MELTFHETGNTGLKGSKKKCDLWVRMSVNAKTGVGIHYAALTQSFVDRYLFDKTKDSTTENPVVEIAIDIRSRVLVGGVTEEHVRPTARKRFKARNGTAYYHTSKPLVVDMVNEFKCDTTKDNHYFKLTPDGSFHGCPRFIIEQIVNL